MTRVEIILTILIAILGTVFTRAIAFIIFKDHKKIPNFVKYLGNVLPFAVMALLVIFSYKDISFTNSSILPKFCASLIVILVHVFKRNMMLSILMGTSTYVFLIN